MKATTALSLFIVSLFLTACGYGMTGNAVADQKLKNSCFDSDGGKNLENFGTVKVTAPSGNNYEIKDQCVGNIYLVESYCEDSVAKTENFVCQDFCDPFENVCF